MRWRPTISLGTWSGVQIRLDLIMVALIGILFFLSLSDASASGAPAGEVWSAVAHLALLVALLLCMFAHELGHAFMCKLRGHQPTMILLSFIGLTFFKASKAKPSDEFWIALAGPMVNLGIGAATAPFIWVALTEPAAPTLLSQASMATFAGFLAWLSILNFAMGLGNLMPGWPLDGARAMRGWMARSYGYAAGTVRAVAISHGFWLIMAGLAVIVMTIAPLIKWASGNMPTRSPAPMIVMYDIVILLMATLGIAYGWSEKRRVARLGAERAAQVVGPPPEFMPRTAPEQEKSTVIDTNATVDGKPAGEAMSDKKPAGPDKVDEIKDKAKEAITTGKTLWKVAKASGKGAGWFARQSVKVLGAMLSARKDEPPKKD